ncbi:MAG: hypothetical protein ACUVXD_12055 [Thermodesulfobacteriota bacterium]
MGFWGWTSWKGILEHDQERARRYVEDHGWSIEVRSEPYGGTTMTISGIRVARQGGSQP